MAKEKIRLEVDASGVALLTIDNPPMNALHPKVLVELFEKLDDCQKNERIKAILITGASGKFTAGFDVQVFRDSNSDMNALAIDVHKFFNEMVESGSKPTVAVIDGICLGGGCELAVACNARVCTPTSRIGLPELQLGIIPGFGGTQRLPRLVGVKKGLEMMLTSKPLSARDALQNGLVDEVVTKEKLLSVAKALALDIADGLKPRLFSLERTDRLEPYSEALQIFDFAHAQSTKQAPNLEHPHFCINAVRYGIEHGGHKGSVKEKEYFVKCIGLDTHKALIHVFFSMRSTKRVKGVTDVGLQPRSISRVAVLGGGLMGSGIATSLVLAGCKVLLKEINESFLKSGINFIQANLQSQVKKGRIKKDAAAKALSLVTGVLDYNDFGSLDMVIEAVLEDIPLKQQVFSDLEKFCNEKCILATNTSTIDIRIVGEKTGAADRIVGAHFFSPAHLMPLLEIVRSDQTSKQVLVDTLELSSKIKKTPVLVGNCTGFAVNRVFFPYTMAACLLVDLGIDPYRIDKVISEKFGMPYGPFRLSDLVGADIGMHVGKNFVEAFPERVYVTRLMILMNNHKRLGEKTGKGFYKFTRTRKASPDPELSEIIKESRDAAGLTQNDSQPIKLTDEDIIEFIFFPVVNEGCRVVSEGIVAKSSDLDVATILGMGFPPYRGGLMFWADLVGARYVHDKLVLFSRMLPKQAAFFHPCQYLHDCAFLSSPLQRGTQLQSRM